jgi:redox-sensitive bicupin YhaK (pirin superfamily)
MSEQDQDQVQVVTEHPQNSDLQIVISSRQKDIGGFSVRRLLPFASHRMVGPFIFFDHIGPAEFRAGTGMDVRPHPHIHLATVTYLFEGRIHHRDSLGSNQTIEPGAINWMTAGRGIVHSERTPPEERTTGSRLSGIQLWVALPENEEETPPSFIHYAKSTLPEFAVGNVKIKLLLGELMGHRSPVAVASALFYAEAHLPPASSFSFSGSGSKNEREQAVYVVDGEIEIGGQTIAAGSMAVIKNDRSVVISSPSQSQSHIMLLGGQPLGPRFIEWNFVSSSKEKIAEAKSAWLLGPSASNQRFQLIPGDNAEFIPLPPESTSRKASIL